MNGEPVNWVYSAIMCGAIAAGFLVARHTQQPLPLSRLQRLGIALGAFVGGMLGAKLPFVLADWDGLVSGRAWFENGKTIVFGLVGGYAGVEVVKSLLDIRIKTGDTFAVPVAVTVGIGRLACFSAGCCYGTVTTLPWAFDFGDGLLRHPTQIYETIFHLSAAVLLAFLRHRGLWRGQLIKLYFIAYLLYRLLTEIIRPEPRLWLGLTFYQWTSLLLIPVFIALWIYDQRQQNAALKGESL